MLSRDDFGRRVREIWVKWASEQPNPKPSWLVRYQDLPEPEKEVDRRIGEGIAIDVLQAIGLLMGESVVALHAERLEAEGKEELPQ